MFRRVFIVLAALMLCKVGYSEQAPFHDEPSLAKRISYSDVVCSVTIKTIQNTGTQKLIGDAQRNVFVADAKVDRVFKGTLSSDSIQFRYYDFGKHPTPNYFGPPTAFFKANSRYVLFLNREGNSLVVSVPVWRMEIPLAPRAITEATTVLSSLTGIADELFYSIRADPKIIGRSATHYFSWAEEVIGKDAIPAVEPFLDSDDELVKYQAAWWLSFRRLNDPVFKVLVETKNNTNIEGWARSGAESRLKDIHEGLWVPK